MQKSPNSIYSIINVRYAQNPYRITALTELASVFDQRKCHFIVAGV